MRLFFRLFNPYIPTYVLLVVLFVAFITTAFQYKWANNRYNAMISTSIVACLVIMLWITLLGRITNGTGIIGHEPRVKLMPLWSIEAIQDGLIETLYEKINNVIFFIPYGFLLGLRCTNDLKGSRGLRSLKGAILTGFITSVTIELLQLITRTGTCETDDVICNTLGCGIGAVMAVGISGLRKLWNSGTRE